ncbi:hypothetical protein NDU88_004297 [Pleurodeles waltl]|uniref:Uncharacterized protein n=1 Tax=Pleurodeles waltl TaxID=8319 RepID=A0AAV7VGN8_PLEWA|nr:hypothetical protein NDU88_004297 [Pleurodeles waltl]
MTFFLGKKTRWRRVKRKEKPEMPRAKKDSKYLCRPPFVGGIKETSRAGRSYNETTATEDSRRAQRPTSFLGGRGQTRAPDPTPPRIQRHQSPTFPCLETPLMAVWKAPWWAPSTTGNTECQKELLTMALRHLQGEEPHVPENAPTSPARPLSNA